MWLLEKCHIEYVAYFMFWTALPEGQGTSESLLLKTAGRGPGCELPGTWRSLCSWAQRLHGRHPGVPSSAGAAATVPLKGGGEENTETARGPDGVPGFSVSTSLPLPINRLIQFSSLLSLCCCEPLSDIYGVP